MPEAAPSKTSILLLGGSLRPAQVFIDVSLITSTGAFTPSHRSEYPLEEW